VAVHCGGVHGLDHATALEQRLGGALLPRVRWNAADLQVGKSAHLLLLGVVAARPRGEEERETRPDHPSPADDGVTHLAGAAEDQKVRWLRLSDREVEAREGELFME
jgi:hypothetical protein